MNASGKTNWTPEMEEQIRRLWNEGKSGSEIAAIMHITSRSSILGKAYRLGLPERKTPGATSKRGKVVERHQRKGKEVGRILHVQDGPRMKADEVARIRATVPLDTRPFFARMMGDPSFERSALGQKASAAG